MNTMIGGLPAAKPGAIVIRMATATVTRDRRPRLTEVALSRLNIGRLPYIPSYFQFIANTGFGPVMARAILCLMISLDEKGQKILADGALRPVSYGIVTRNLTSELDRERLLR